MIKFRTMVAEAPSLQSELEAANEAEGPLFKIRDDPRVTRVGRFLRRFSLDEIPQVVERGQGRDEPRRPEAAPAPRLQTARGLAPCPVRASSRG